MNDDNSRQFTADLAVSAGLDVDRLPQNDEEANLANEALSKEFEKLSIDEKEKILFDLHGLDTCCELQEEEPFSLKVKLGEFDNELSKIDHKPAYERAKYLDQTFVEDTSFRLMFLRAERFNAKKSAALMVFHFKMKLELFGDSEILCRDIRQQDLSSDDLDCLRSGSMQVCPLKDVGGRTILSYFKMLKKYKHPDNANRAMWYTAMTVLKDEDVQKQGAIMVAYNYWSSIEKVTILRKHVEMHAALPIRWVAGHFCYDDPRLHFAVTGFRLLVLPTFAHFRFRTHWGSPEDIAFRLQTFGIPTENTPTDKEGFFSVPLCHYDWIKVHESRDEQASVPDAITIPRRFDVLFGKGNAKYHTGNLRCIHLVEMVAERYENTKRADKTEVADEVVSMIHNSHGRFLKWNNGVWTEVDHKTAREKVSNYFRSLRGHRSKGTREKNSAVKKRSQPS